jgi:predicted phage terminase large subunit-like protein
MDAWAANLDFHDLVNRVIATCKRAKVDHLVIEAKNNGISLGQEIMRITRDELWTTHMENPTVDKMARAYAIQHLFSAKLVFAPHRTWATKVIDQCAVFPKGKHDDLVDSTTQALGYLRRLGLARLHQESIADLVKTQQYRPARKLPYDV